MLSIGEFAQATGLTVKALRHYDERGVLVPARVDPRTRHRGYGGGQLHDAVLIKALRAADLPVEVVRRALDRPGAAGEIVTGFRAELAAARAAQDAALDAADRLAAALADPAPVCERDAPEQHYAAVRLTVPTADELLDEIGQVEGPLHRAAGALHAELTRRGAAPDGPFWTGFGGEGGDSRTATIELCWPVPTAVPDLPDRMAGVPVQAGLLPRRRELVARWDRGADELTPHGLPHPAMVALTVELSRREQAGLPDPMAEQGTLRQLVRPGEDPEGTPVVELCVDLP